MTAEPSPPPGIALRPATHADAARLAASIGDAFERYRSFAPAGWAPVTAAAEAERIAPLLGRDDVWWLLAERDGVLAGHTGMQPATLSHFTSAEAGLGHVRALFVEPSFWGSGLARVLHARILVAAAERGFANLRLFTPAGQARARRFYEREGWVAVAELPDNPLGLPMVEYRRAVADAG